MQVFNPLPLFFDSAGQPLDAGYVYIGEAGADPETTPVATFFDADLSVAAAQPLRTRGGMVVNGITPSAFYIAEGDYSIRVKDADGDTIYSLASVTQAETAYQPLDSDLTAIAALATTSYGRALLTLANQAALKAATGIVDGIPATGGTVSGNITRSGAGPHVYHGDATLNSGKITISAVGGGNPTTQPGEIWIGI